ncbi:MAG: hypothetical protein PHD43_02625 [Methylococcales bacterium]|nr:hypothetical protein [Methylococcales bacterium]
MHELTDRELYQALEYAKSIDEDDGRKIIEQFQLEQTALAQTIFDIFPTVIAEENQEMSYLFMDLCFDVLCVFQKAFGPLPSQNDMDIDWIEKQAVLLDAELLSLIKDKYMDDKIRSKLQDRFLNRVIKDNSQMRLVNFMNAAIDDFASENPIRVPAIKTTQTMIFIVIRLFSNLYSHVNKSNMT